MEKVGIITNQPTLDISSQTLEQCLKGTSQFSGTLYQNICDGTQYFVANGFWDYSLGFGLLAVVIAIALTFLRIALD